MAGHQIGSGVSVPPTGAPHDAAGPRTGLSLGGLARRSSSLRSMDRTRLAAFATCLATSLEPFFSRFSQRTPANVFADLTALLWEVFANSESQLKARTILESVSA